VDEHLEGKATITEFDEEFGPEPATNVIEAMWGELAKRFYINTTNRGAAPNTDALMAELSEAEADAIDPTEHAGAPVAGTAR